MPMSGFHSEWITIGQHRILLECRASFPNEWMRFLAQVAVATCNANSEGRARVTQIYFDDRSSTWTIDVASDNETDRQLESILITVLHTMFSHGNCLPRVKIVPAGDKVSDHYDRTEWLSVAAGVAVDRWEQHDPECQAKVRLPR